MIQLVNIYILWGNYYHYVIREFRYSIRESHTAAFATRISIK
jgi:hypothetical protein